MIRQLHILVSGRVQGVFFRYSTRRRAETLGLTGYARNLYDGSVEIVAQGDQGKLNSLLSWARHGPPAAHVTDVAARWEQPKKPFHSFSIR